MNYSEALNYIFSLKTVSLKPSLDRMTSALELIGNPQNSLRAIHIAGTNGKGSVASMISEILIAGGKKVGLFISPYIIDFAERIQVNGRYISQSDLSRLVNVVASVQPRLLEKNLELGQFEFITAVAFLYFKEQNCDYVVLETGLGGRFDATNVISNPICTVITKISYDHTAILGDTLKQIAGEKAGIIKHSTPCVTWDQHSEAMDVITDKCADSLAPMSIVNPKNISNVRLSLTGTAFKYKNQEFFTTLCGAHQAENASLAIETINYLGDPFSYEIINKGLREVKHPCRIEAFGENRSVIIDGAHNPDGARSLAAFLKTINFKGDMIFGGMKDKNLHDVAKILSPFASRVITVTVKNNPRAQKSEELKSIFLNYIDNVVAAESYDEALKLVEGNSALICGSLYLAADMRRYFDKTN